MVKQSETDGKIGRSRGGLTCKIHAATDGDGIRVLGDKGYDSAQILSYIKYRHALACIPPRKNKTYPQKYNKKAYRNRNQIERFFQRLKNFRRIATRYDKLPSSFLSFVYVASISILIPKFPSFV